MHNAHTNAQLRDASLEPSETKPYVVDNGKVRSLHFNAEEIQSAMWPARPDALYLEYTRLMMGFLLFNAAPRTITMIGLGGGSLAKFCHRYLPGAHLVVVENNAEVIALRDTFSIPPDDACLRVIEGDGVAYIEKAADHSLDILLVDGYGDAGLPPPLCSQPFYDQCQRVLNDNGILVCNLHEAHVDFTLQLARIGRSFGATLMVREGERGNCIVLAGGLAFAKATRHVATRRPQDLDREAWMQLKSAFGRIVAAARADSP